MASEQKVWTAIKQYFTTAPIVFPLIGLFHVGMLVYLSISWLSSSVGFVYHLRPVVLAAYTALWIGTCFLRKKYATAYLVMTIVMVCFYYLFPTGHFNNFDSQTFFGSLGDQLAHLHDAVADILLYPLPANILFSFIILFYYRKMQPQRKPELIPENKLPEEVKSN